ncbi:MAG: DUF4340 domain-containing protein [Spirochaetia bacterium]
MITLVQNFFTKRLSKSVIRLLKWGSFIILLTMTVKTVRWSFATKEKVQAQIEQPKELVLRLPVAQMSRVQIFEENREVDFQKIRNTWYIKDQTFKLDQDRMNTLLEAMSNLEVQQLLNAQLDLAKYGLEKAQTTVQITLRNRRQVRILIGNKVPTRRLYYLQMEGNPQVYLLDGNIGDLFFQDIQSYGDLQIPPIDWVNLQQVYIQSPSGNIKIHSSEKGDFLTKFQFSEPSQYAKMSVSTQAFAQLWNLWAMRPLDKRSLQMGIEDWREYGLLTPVISLEIQDMAGVVLLLKIGKQNSQGDYYARLGDENAIFVIPKSYVQPLTHLSAFSLVNKFVALVPIQDVSSFSLLSKNEKFWGQMTEDLLDGQPTEIKVKKSKNIDADQIQVHYRFNGRVVSEVAFQSLYEPLVSLAYERERDIKERLGRPVWDLTFYDKSGKTLRNVGFLAYNRRQYAVTVNGKLMPLTIGPAQIEKLLAKMREIAPG